MSMWPKACPRCSGDLVREIDIDGTYVSCLQCGYQLSGQQEAFLLRQSLPKTRTAVARNVWASQG